MSKRLKVLFITASYPDKNNPHTGIFIREHAKAVRLYNEVVVLHCSISDPPKRGLWHIEEERDLSLTEGITTYRVWYRLLPLPKGATKVSYPIYIYSVSRAFHWLLEQGFQPDVIHAHFYRAGAPASRIGKIYGLPVIITEHSSAFPRRLLGWDEVLKARFAFQRANIVLPVSRALQQGIEAYGIKAHFTIVPNVVDTNIFHPGPLPKPKINPKRLLFVGFLLPVKGLNYLLNALAMLHQDRNDWHIDIVGDSPLRVEYEQMAKELGLENKVTFHGFKPKSKIAEFMRQADLFILPSIWENMPCVLIESMCCGLPIVSTTVGGIPEIVPNSCGILVPPADPQALMQAINRVLNLDKQFDRASIADWAKQNYSYDIVGQKLHTIYQEVYNR